ncbi:DUF1801 domain-containing protein [Sphingomonas sp. GC_Shp_2]|uniref:DUF1801 domain-containing protein n=2 Tax=unclassified Sphingomonas TaxID=196159 RepID=UPI002269824C
MDVRRMVQSAAPTVEAFLSVVEPERVDAIRRLREECRARLIGWEERMQWGMPGYGPPGSDARISFNSQKGYISVYLGKSTLDRHKASVKGAAFGKGCVRYRRPDKIDFTLLGTMLSESFHEKGGGE